MKLRKTIAALLVLIFALVAVPTLFLRSIASTYLNPNFYEGKVVEQTYEYVVDFIADEAVKEKDINAYFSKDDIKDLIYKYISADIMQGLVKDFTTQLKGINDGRKNGAIIISLAPIKENMSLMAGDITTKIIENTKICETDEENVIEDIKYVDGKLACIPREANIAEITQEIKHKVEKELNNVVPGEFTLELSAESNGNGSLKQIMSFVDYLQIILPLIMLVFLLLMALFIYSPYSVISEFTGFALLLGGVFGLIASQLLRQIPSIAVTQSNLPDLDALEISNLQEIYSFFISFIVERMSVYSLYLLGMGIVIFLFGLYLRHFHEHTGGYTE